MSSKVHIYVWPCQILVIVNIDIYTKDISNCLTTKSEIKFVLKSKYFEFKFEYIKNFSKWEKDNQLVWKSRKKLWNF